MSYLFTSESVSEGHPDKVADQISDAVLDNFLAFDETSKVACETLVTTGLVVLAGEVKSNAYLDLQKISRGVINRIGYTKSAYMFDGNSCAVLSSIHEQSAEINEAVVKHNVEEQGAGDQGMMFGYATNETENFMPLSLELSHLLVKELANIRKEAKEMTYLRPDTKAQVTVEYSDDHKPQNITTIVISTQHDEYYEDGTKIEQSDIEKDIKHILIKRVKAQLSERLQVLFNENIVYHINPSGKFVIGGPHGDTGLTGRKIIVDTYGGRGAHGGGAFSGKDPSKVDRSAAYATRHIAKNIVAAGICDRVLVQVAYAIGKASPVSLCIDTYGTAKTHLSDTEIAEIIKNMQVFDMTPSAIEKRFQLKMPIYSETAAYGHMGRKCEKVVKTFLNGNETKEVEVKLFPWEELNCVEDIKQKIKTIA